MRESLKIIQTLGFDVLLIANRTKIHKAFLFGHDHFTEIFIKDDKFEGKFDERVSS